MTLLHARPYGKFIDTQQPQERETSETNQGYNFLGGSFSNRDNITTPIQFRREKQSQYLKR